MASRTPEVEEARQRLARAQTKHERKTALRDYNLAMGREPREVRKGGYDDYYGGYGRYNERLSARRRGYW